MPTPPLPADALQLLAAPNPAVIGTVRPDGAPVTVATWYLLDDDGRILVNMDEGRRRLAHLRANPRASLTVLAEDWGTHLSVQGPVDLRPDPDFVDIDRLCRHYTRHPFPDHERARVSGYLTIERWHGWGALRQPARG